MIHIGVDLHQRFCYCTAVKASGEVIAQRSVANEAESLRRFVRSLPQPAQVVVEACGFWPAFKKAVEKEVERVVMVHPQRVKAIAAAKLKNDRIDSATLAHLLRCDLLPEAWMADEATRELRQQVRMRATLVRQRTRLKNQVHAILHQQGLRFAGSDVFGRGGRAWLKQVSLPAAGGNAIRVYLKLIDEFSAQIKEQQQQLQKGWETDTRVKWLKTIPGIGWYSAILLVAEIGDVERFADKRALANYAGLVPWLRESADKRRSGSITRVGSPWLRWIMVEAAQTALRKYPEVQRWAKPLLRKKHKNTVVVAIARKLLVAVWAMLHDGVAYDEKHFAIPKAGGAKVES
jgi:transposase